MLRLHNCDSPTQGRPSWTPTERSPSSHRWRGTQLKVNFLWREVLLPVSPSQGCPNSMESDCGRGVATDPPRSRCNCCIIFVTSRSCCQSTRLEPQDAGRVRRLLGRPLPRRRRPRSRDRRARTKTTAAARPRRKGRPCQPPTFQERADLLVELRAGRLWSAVPLPAVGRTPGVLRGLPPPRGPRPGEPGPRHPHRPPGGKDLHPVFFIAPSPFER